mgnify:CR=1 FL=1
MWSGYAAHAEGRLQVDGRVICPALHRTCMILAMVHGLILIRREGSALSGMLTKKFMGCAGRHAHRSTRADVSGNMTHEEDEAEVPAPSHPSNTPAVSTHRQENGDVHDGDLGGVGELGEGGVGHGRVARAEVHKRLVLVSLSAHRKQEVFDQRAVPQRWNQPLEGFQ